MSERFDVVIIGAGPAGLAAGVTAARRGMSHLVLDRGVLAETVSRYQRGKHVMAEPEPLPLHGELELGFEAGSRESVLDRWARDSAEAGVQIRLGAEHEVLEVEGAKGSFELRLKNGQKIGCAHLVLAIGVQGNLRTFEVPGSELPHVSYQLDDPAEHEGESIVIVGVGDAGIENALALAEYGNDVAIVNRRDEIDRAKARNRALLEAAIRAGQITYYPNTTVERFEPGAVSLSTAEGTIVRKVDLVIGRLGAVPPRRFLESLGVAFPSSDPAAVPAVNEHYETSAPGIHLIGAVAGYPLIKNCMNQGFEVIEHLLGHAVTPADEPLLRAKFEGLEGSVAEVIERVRESVPLFACLAPIQLREFLAGSEVRRRGPKETVFQRNDYSDSFYTILDGEVEVRLPASDREAESDRRAAERKERVVTLGTGDFFGEASLISGRRRNATIRTSAPSLLIETPRSNMNALVHSSADVKKVLDTAFIDRVIENFLPRVPAPHRAELARDATLEVYRHGDSVFEQGDTPDGLHLIRRGAVTITRRVGDREVVLNYVQAGNFIGEVALVSRDQKRTATARAAVRTETIRLSADHMADFLAAHPELRDEFRARALVFDVTNVRVSANRRGTDLVGFLLNVGAGEATDLLLIDESLCIRCNNCEIACGETHGGVSRLDREGGPYFGTVHVPTACQHCENPKCMDDCPPDALRRDPEGEVYVLDCCIGCGNCVSNCPYNVIQLAKVREKGRKNLLLRLLFGVGAGDDEDGEGEKLAVKCDLCRSLPANEGPAQGWSACVEACPTGAVVRRKPRAMIDQILGGEG